VREHGRDPPRRAEHEARDDDDLCAGASAARAASGRGEAWRTRAGAVRVPARERGRCAGVSGARAPVLVLGHAQKMVGTTDAMLTMPTFVELKPHTACMCSGSAGSIAVSAILRAASAARAREERDAVRTRR
jgi:hypothetical protein